MKSIILFLCLLLPTIVNAQHIKLDGNELKTEEKILFSEGKFKLSSSDINTLKVVKEFLDEKPSITLLRIESHVDNTQNNQELSEFRAIEIAKWLVNSGIDCKRLICVGFGNNKPAEENSRINFIVAGLVGKIIGGLSEDGGGKVAADVCKLNKSSK